VKNGGIGNFCFFRFQIDEKTLNDAIAKDELI